VKLANHLDIETQDVAAALHIHPFMLSRWKKEYREGRWKGSGHPDLKEINDREATVAEYKGILGLGGLEKGAYRE
jgi:transposase